MEQSSSRCHTVRVDRGRARGWRDLRGHPALVSAEAQQLIELAQEHGALGWKVNGAGGDGGSLSLLMGAESAQKRSLLRDLAGVNTNFQHIPTYLSRFGLRVWDSP